MNQDIIKEVLYAPELSPTVLLLVLAVAFVLGAIHALGPGHGKSLMAAYLIGSKGRIKDAITLALALTISHVLSVIILGFIALWVTDFFLPEKVNKWLGVLSGILVFGIGLWLLISRTRAMEKRIKPELFHGGTSANTVGNLHHHSQSHAAYDSHQAHDNPHDHAHNHANNRHHHHHFDPNFSLWNNIALGISGGIIPCPKAIVILLLAISLHKIALGIIIILVFSLGLSTVLVALGIIMLKATHLLKGRLEARRVQALPIIGAIVILGLGILITVRAWLA
ncbi:sulfite exporter TauE/SafE family protein [candidate division KSB1 bacterium]|nr:sulfite exporter TauE/SafE family protein [candidate division KSB1 bacterium]